MNSDLKTALIAGASAIVGGAIVAVGDYLVRERELDIKMMEIAVGLLKEKPDGPLKPVRDWAVDVIVYYSTDVPLSEQARAALKEHPVDIRPFGGFAFGGGSFGGGPSGGASGDLDSNGK